MRNAVIVGSLVVAGSFVSLTTHAVPIAGTTAAPTPPRRVGPVGCQPVVDTSPLKIFLPFNGNATDETGHCNDGGISGATLTTDRKGVANRAYLFDGTDDFIQLREGQAYDFTRFTIALYVKPAGFPKLPSILGPSFGPIRCAYSTLVTKGTATTPEYWGNFGLELKHCGGASYFDISYAHMTPPLPGSTYPRATGFWDTNAKIELGKWYHLAVTYDGTSLTSYVNGNRSRQEAMGAPISSPAPIRIGIKAKLKPVEEEEHRPFQGALDEVRIYGRALSASEIAALQLDVVVRTDAAAPPAPTLLK